MLILKYIGTEILQVDEGAGFSLPDGRYVSPAYAGWSNSDGYTLVAPPSAGTVPPTHEEIDAERNRRMRGTLLFNGKLYDCDQDSLQRIVGAATLAGFAIAGGALPGNLYWHGGASPFSWIAHDNSIEPMDAQTMFAFGQAAAASETAHIFAARALKDMDPPPADFASDIYWP